MADAQAAFPSAPAPSGALKWKPALIAVAVCQAVICFMRFAIDDCWGAVTDGVIIILAYFAIFDMSIMYILWYMVLCVMVFAFDIVYLSIRATELKKRFFSSHHHPVENLTSLLVTVAP
eukprot:gene417-602_t